ncbi:MAG: TetR family transcriptional regulator [Rhodobacterales bacterium]|nr:MAG: TetR family transcriptional regulator [Rhodobacterales bacterium]
MARKQGSHSDITRPRIREAALRLIARDGFAAVSMRQIAREVGVQAGALYNYTDDKQSLLVDLMARHMEELLAAVADTDLGSGNAPERLDAFTRFHIRWHLPRRDGVFVSYMELRNLSPENFARIEQLRRRYEDVLEDILRDGMEEGAFELAEPRLTTMALISLLTGVTNWYKAEGRLDLDELEALYVGLVRRAVGADNDPQGMAAE